MTMQAHRSWEAASPQNPSGRRFGASSWLVTFADLMTILVCFFVLIVSFSIQDQVKLEVVAGSMRDAFGVAEERRYAGDVKSTGTPDQRQPGNVIESPTPTSSGLKESLSANPALGSDGLNMGRAPSREAANANLNAVARRLEDAVLAHPILADEADSITIIRDMAGLQILLVDGDGEAMFDKGAATPTPRARDLLLTLGRTLAPLANRMVVEAHADATGQGGYDAFALTAERANRARTLLNSAGISENRILGIAGRGAAAPLYPEDPYAAANRRIELRIEPAAPLMPETRSL